MFRNGEVTERSKHRKRGRGGRRAPVAASGCRALSGRCPGWLTPSRVFLRFCSWNLRGASRSAEHDVTILHVHCTEDGEKRWMCFFGASSLLQLSLPLQRRAKLVKDRCFSGLLRSLGVPSVPLSQKVWRFPLRSVIRDGDSEVAACSASLLCFLEVS